ncbi:hypothetical protein [Gracilibacillus salinarum]|uniref:Uncharacterized protein n=1 Tax=Gracilibacillus salinarum TaxID=2932255 RepID=A0ABY4GSB1_9BACI|nr:hypothetical protein [Gracilibacillus salinarum]UOQ87091.1 hypothetical protein MUN87_09510 [Gracilibacillus salinarum]
MYINTFNNQSLHLNNSLRIESNQTTREDIKNSASIKLDKLTLSDVVGEMRKDADLRLKVTEMKEKEQNDSDYDKYYSSFLGKLEGVPEEDKNQLTELIKTALKRNGDYFSNGWTSDKESMYHLQTQEKLNLIAEKLAPDSVRDELLSITNQYTNDKLDQTVNKSLSVYEAIYNRDKGKAGEYVQIVNRMKNSIKNIQEGNHDVQVEQKQYKELFSNLNSLPPFQNQYEEVMTGYKEIQKDQLDGSWNKKTESRIDKNIQLLREDWNDFVSQFEELDFYRLSSDKYSKIDFKV